LLKGSELDFTMCIDEKAQEIKMEEEKKVIELEKKLEEEKNEKTKEMEKGREMKTIKRTLFETEVISRNALLSRSFGLKSEFFPVLEAFVNDNKKALVKNTCDLIDKCLSWGTINGTERDSLIK
jgi:hypothetical protein